MKPRTLMIMGASVGIFAAALSTVATPTTGTIVFVFMSGALFGKGYGVWEQRAGRQDQGGKE